MILKDNIEQLAGQFLEETDKFIMDIAVKPGNLIIITIDGDSLVTIEDCIKLSRFIENNLDRDTEDFELRVMSYGAESPLLIPRQYQKHLGRDLDITPKEGEKVQGKLAEVNEDSIVVLRKKSAKKQPAQSEGVTLKFDEIETAKIILSFK